MLTGLYATFGDVAFLAGAGWLNTLDPWLLCARLFLQQNISKNTSATNAMNPNIAPIAIPTFAPVDKPPLLDSLDEPDDDDEDVGEDVDVAKVIVAVIDGKTTPAHLEEIAEL